jgi:hypothetical protein
MVSLIASLLLLLAMGSVGVAALRRAGACLTPLEYVAYGVPFGAVLVTLVVMPLATLFGLTTALILMLGLVSGVSAVLLSTDRLPGPAALRRTFALPALNRESIHCAVHELRTRIGLVPALVIGTAVVRLFFLFQGTFFERDGGLWAGHVNVWGDWALHLGDVASFAYGDNFPPMEPRLAGHPFSYHFLVSLTPALFVKLGMAPTSALELHSFVFAMLVVLGFYAFVRRLTGDSSIAGLALTLLLLGGSLGWVLTIGEMDRSNSIIGTLVRKPWFSETQEPLNFRWLNAVFAFLLPQRPFLYGLPLALLVMTLLYGALREKRAGLFSLAGMAAGLLPFAHLGTMLALALITPFLFLLFPRRDWFWFFAVWVALATPQLLVQQAGSAGAAGALRLQIGWIAAPDPWLWFWLKNLGLFIPLLFVAFAVRDLLEPVARRMLLAFMPVFVIANVVVFQPWPWDNTKVLLYWFAAVCIFVAALLVRTLRKYRDPVVWLMVSIAVVTMVLSGVLENVQQATGKTQFRLLEADELRLAALVRESTSPHAVFLIGLHHNHPVSMLTGRTVVMGYPGWIWTHGMNYGPRESDVRAMLAFDPNTLQLLQRYGVDYVAIGPIERDQLKANAEAYRSRFPRVIATDTYEVFDVRGR